MAGDKAVRDESRNFSELAFLYTQTLTSSQDTNQSGLRVIRATGDGFQIAGHAQVDGVAFSPLLIRDVAVHDGPEIDIREIDKTLFTLKSDLDQALTVTFFGLIATSGDLYPIKTVAVAIGSVTTQLLFETVTDPWKFIQIRAQAAIAPAAGSFGATFEEET